MTSVFELIAMMTGANPPPVPLERKRFWDIRKSEIDGDVVMHIGSENMIAFTGRVADFIEAELVKLNPGEEDKLACGGCGQALMLNLILELGWRSHATAREMEALLMAMAREAARDAAKYAMYVEAGHKNTPMAVEPKMIEAVK